jgi:hypothetical protein
MLCWEAIQDVTLIILIVAATVSLILFFVTKYALHTGGGEDEEENLEWIDSVAIYFSVLLVVLVSGKTRSKIDPFFYKR